MTTDTKELWAWMTEYPDGTVGMVGAMFEGNHTPLIGRDEDAVRRFEWIARMHMEMTGQRVWLRCFSQCIDEADLTEVK